MENEQTPLGYKGLSYEGRDIEHRRCHHLHSALLQKPVWEEEVEGIPRLSYRRNALREENTPQQKKEGGEMNDYK